VPRSRNLLAIAALPLAALPAVGGVAGSQPPDAAGGSAFESMLATMPAAVLKADGALVSYVDMTLIWAGLGVGDGPQERIDNVGRLNEVGPWWTTGPQVFSPYDMQLDEARAEVGFSTFEIDRELAVLAPPRHVIVVETSVPADTITAAVESDPLWSADLRQESGPAGPYWSWGGEDFDIDPARQSPLHSLGRGGQLALIGDAPATVLRTLATDDMAAAQQTIVGDAPSVLDEGVLADTLAAVGDETVVQAMGVPQPTLLDPAAVLLGSNVTPEQVEEVLAQVAGVGPYLGLLVAEVADGDSTRTEILLAHPSPGAAADNVAAVEAHLSEGIDMSTQTPVSELLPGATVAAEGSVVRVTFSGPDAYRIALTMLQQRALLPIG
jgi:hypothetical protein